MIRWLLIPFALLIAIGAGSFFLFLASIVDPVMATLTGETLFVGLSKFFDAIVSADDPGLVVAHALSGIGRLIFIFLVFPALLVAVIGEAVRARSLIWYGGATGVLTAAVPWILRGSAHVAAPGELHVSAVLGLTGAVTGLVYWLVAGRDTGRGRDTPR
ncbi:hypothetical protein [Microvirga terricola]|uniref:Uncharacterized protein n=1 Tax=Microvirga terricola TaxID=2719797 RepID=A0ABX0V6A3_9HYPH|nr:hypothetical protein [Microvirga terricola]NIX75362.1 hypothetical protein [Microvirga terricola]